MDERSLKFQSLMMNIQHCLKLNPTFKCDGNSSYPKWITNIVPTAILDTIIASKKKVRDAKQKEYDEQFAINNTFARMRHDMNCLGRKTFGN